MLRPEMKNKMHPEGWVTVKQYATMKGITPQSVYQSIKNNWVLPDVVERAKIGSTHMLRVTVAS